MTAPASDYVVRAARGADIDDFIRLKGLAGLGFTSLAVPDDTLAARLTDSARNFSAPLTAPGEERYFLALEHRPTRAIVGMGQVKASIGLTKPFFNYRVLRIAQASAAAARRFDLDVLALVNEFTGCTEVGSLFVQAEHRRAGVGRALAQARYMLMAAAPDRFGARVISELRGVISDEGVSPFWEHLGRPFFRMSFMEADQLSATTDNQFILDLMPKYPIYVDLLPREARDVIGQCHRDGVGAQKLLTEEGFRYDRVIDIFDGGPVMTAPLAAIRTRRSARLRPARAGAPASAVSGLLATPAVGAFRCAPAAIDDRGDHVVVTPDALAAIGAQDGGPALVWLPDGA
jgi:arginine N-succinyltransferase